MQTVARCRGEAEQSVRDVAAYISKHYFLASLLLRPFIGLLLNLATAARNSSSVIALPGRQPFAAQTPA